jgi:2-polyprenyl-6-methoxyphenol hydroxylase-like FAD-dependent oxidoreductase
MGVSRVLVVGGGITGSVAATALAQRGVEVDLVEIVPEWKGTGHGITLQGNALRSFSLIGVWDEVRAAGFPFERVRLRRADGSLIVDVTTPRTGGQDLPATLGSLRSDLQRILSAAVYAAGVTVRLGLSVRDWHCDPAGVDVTFTDGSAGRYDLVVGADGIRSQLRGQLGIETAPQPTGMSIWRILVRREPDMDCSELFYEGPRYKAGYTPISPDLCYAYLLDEDGAAPGSANPGSANPGSANPGSANPGSANPGSAASDWQPPAAALRERSAGYGGHWGPIRDQITDDTPVNYQRVESLLVPAPWYRDRVIIIGDAVHACPPLIAQGAAMCTEDAIVLAELVTGEQPADAALKEFMRRRLDRVRLVVQNSLTLSEWEINPSTPGADPARIMAETLSALEVPA